MTYKIFIINAIGAFCLFIALIVTASPETAPARHTEALKNATIASLMGRMQIQVIKPVSLPAFTLSDVFKQPFKIKDQVGKVILINFWTRF